MCNAMYADDFHWTIHLIQDLYNIHAKNKSRELAAYFDKFALFTEILFKAMIISFASVTSTFFVYPFYMYFVKGELMPIMPLYLPFVDESTCIGYIALNVYQFLCCIISVVGFSALEFLMTIIIISSLIFSKLIGRELQQINVDLRDDECNMLMVLGRLTNIFLMHQEMGECVYLIEFKFQSK